MTNADIAAVMRLLSDAYPKHGLSARQLAVYADLLGDLNAADLMAGARRHIQISSFFPSVAELRAQAQTHAGERERRCARCDQPSTLLIMVDGRPLCDACRSPPKSALASAVEVRELVGAILAKVPQ